MPHASPFSQFIQRIFQAMESSKTPINESTTISIPPKSVPQFPISHTKISKSEGMEKWFHSYEKTQWQQSERSLEEIGMEKEGNRVAEAPEVHPRRNAPSVYVGSKVGKKRSRASRKAPTTVLSTDAWNFRAMVQHFTGFPQSSQTPLPNPTFHNNPPISVHIPIPPPHYSSLLFHHDFNPSPLFHPRAGATPLRQTALMDDVGLNQPTALERRPGFGYFH